MKEAAQNEILRGLVGSTVYGLALAGTDDRDEMGVCLEPAEYVVGLQHFEQWQFRTAVERWKQQNMGLLEPRRGESPPSQAGDLDLTVYSLRKWCRLALAGNPSILLLLFVPEAQLQVLTDDGRMLRAQWEWFASKQAANPFLGYLRQQRERLTGERGQRNVNRRELVGRFGYDTKYAMHMLRLGYQGVEYLMTGRLTLPIAEPTRSRLFDVRIGKVGLEEVLEECRALEADLEALRSTSPLPAKPAYDLVDRLLVRLYMRSWAEA